MNVFHRTDHAAAIQRNGFQDGVGHYGTPVELRGVFVSDRPLDENEGARGASLLVLELPESVFARYELSEPEKPYREALVPAAVLNKFGASLHLIR